MTDLSRRSVLVFDSSASYTHIAQACVPDFANVYYYSIWEKAFPISNDLLPGIGVPGIERVSDFFEALDKTDLVIFTDVGNCGLQEYLRRQGMLVFGSGIGGRIEQDRWGLKETARGVGIDISDAVLIHGIDNLRKILATESDLYIKLSYFRGNMESYHHVSPTASKMWVEDVALRLGPYGPLAEFIVEQPIAGDVCVEVGADPAFVCDGRFPSTMLWGFEEKDAAYIGTTHALPSRIESVISKLSPVLRECNYRGPLSTETRECEDKSYLIDLTCRMPEPPSSVHSFMVENWGEIFWEVANGNPVEPEYSGEYAVEIVLKSAWGAEHPLPVKIGMPERVRLHGHAVIDKQHYAVSPAELEEFGAACGIGHTLESAVEEALEAAKSVEAFQAHYDESAISKLMETIRDGQQLGLDWGKIKGEDHAEASR